MERSAARTRALEEPRHLLDAVTEPDDRPVKQQCNHFSIREYVALLQKKDPKLYSLSQNFCKQQHQQDEHQNLRPIPVTKFRRWNCSSCLDKVNRADRTTSITLSPKQNATDNSGCSISFVRSVLPTSVHHTRLPTCTQRSSQGNEVVGSAFPKSTQECNSKCNSPSGSKGLLIEMNVDPATKESQESPNNLQVKKNMLSEACRDVSVLPDVPQIISSTEANCTKESQELPDNFYVMENILNDVSVDISILPDVPQMILSTAGNGTKVLQESPDNLDVMENISNDVPQVLSSREETDTQTLSSPKSCEVLNEDGNERINDILNGDCSVPNVSKPAEDKGPKPISALQGSQIRNRGPRQAASKRNAGSSSKKKQNSTYPSEISDVKLGQRKRKRMRRLSELIETDQAGGSTNSIDVDHAGIDDLCEIDKGKISSEVEKDIGTAVSNQRTEEIQSITVQNKTMLRVDDVDDRSSLMNWLKRTQKKMRTEKKDTGHRNVISSSISISAPGIPATEKSASQKLHQNFVPAVGDQSQEDDPATSNGNHGNKNVQNSYQEPNVLQPHDLCRHEPGNSKQGSLSKGNSTILLKRKVLPTDDAKHVGTKSGNRIVKKNRLKEDDKGQMASINSQKRLTKVSLSKCDTHNVSGACGQKTDANKKKEKAQVLDKQTDEMDDIPMDIVELLARHQHERQQMTNSDSLENSHSQPSITQEDCDQMTANDGSIDASTVPDTDFQESLTSRRKKKILSHASASTEAPNVHLLEEFDTHMSVQGHTVSVMEAPYEQMENSLPVRAEAFHVYPPKLRIPDILMCAEGQQKHSHMDKEVTIACVSPTFLHHQDIAEAPTWNLGTNRTKKLMWDSFKTASRNPSTSSYGAQFRSGFREGGSAPTHVYGASNNYPTYPPAVEHYTKKAVHQAPLRNQAMEAGRLYDQRTPGESGLYPRETMPATHLLRLMDSSTASGFTNRSRMESEASGSSRYLQNQYKASLGTSYGSHLIKKFPLTTLEDLSRHQVPQNLHRPLRPLPRVGVLGSLLQQDIAKWSEHRGAHTGYRPGVGGVSTGIAPFDTNRKENCEASNSGMFSGRWNALQLGSVSSAATPDYSSARRYSEEQSWTKGKGKVAHPLDKLVRKDICQTNRNPADFTIISDKNEYMRNC